MRTGVRPAERQPCAASASCRRRTSPLAHQHPAGVFGRQAAHRVELLQLVGAQADLRGRQVVGQLIGPLGTDDHAGDRRLVQQPGQGDLRHRHPTGLRHRPHGVDAVEGAVALHRREVEAAAAAVRVTTCVAPELAAQQAAGERAPDHQAQAFAGQHRRQLAFQVAPGHRVVGLQ
jgi:hypothetical protein